MDMKTYIFDNGSWDRACEFAEGLESLKRPGDSIIMMGRSDNPILFECLIVVFDRNRSHVEMLVHPYIKNYSQSEPINSDAIDFINDFGEHHNKYKSTIDVVMPYLDCKIETLNKDVASHKNDWSVSQKRAYEDIKSMLVYFLNIDKQRMV